MTFIDKYKLRILNSYATEKLLKNIEEILKVLLERLKIEWKSYNNNIELKLLEYILYYTNNN